MSGLDETLSICAIDNCSYSYTVTLINKKTFKSKAQKNVTEIFALKLSRSYTTQPESSDVHGDVDMCPKSYRTICGKVKTQIYVIIPNLLAGNLIAQLDCMWTYGKYMYKMANNAC